MKPAPFEYCAPRSLDEAIAALAEDPDETRLLAGGQSLVPMLNLRLAHPARLVDLNRVQDSHLTELRADGNGRGGLVIGAMVRESAAERASQVRERSPLLAEALPLIGHPAIRNRGTIGGSMAHADPAAELPAVALALDAQFVATSGRGDRAIGAADFFAGYFTTALEPDECLTEVRLPPWTQGTGWSFQEVCRRHGDFAMVGVAAIVGLDDGQITDARIALSGVAPQPVRATEAEALLVKATPSSAVFADATERAMAGLDPPSDVHGSSTYRRHIAGVLVRRALEEATQRAGGAK